MAKKNKINKSDSDVVNKKEVVIKIDDDLSPEQEAIEVAKQLMEKKMLGASSEQKLIGNGNRVKIKHLETKIVIKRISKEKPVELLVCSVCQTQYEEKLGFPYYTNIGGMIKKKTNCSEQCADFVISISPNRFSKNKSNLRPAFLYKHYSNEKQSEATV